MTLSQAKAAFVEHCKQRQAAGGQPPISLEHLQELDLLTEYFSETKTFAVSDVTAVRLRDFMGRWYVEQAAAARRSSDPGALPAALAEFLIWTDHNAGTAMWQDFLPALAELEKTLPLALEISRSLSAYLSEQGGTFTFPEFLTSFEAGGSSRYDLDEPGDVGALEGYFRILRVEGRLAEAEETISGQTVWPVIFPDAVAGLIRPGFILNLEVVRAADGWHIVDCGFAYPPGTDL